MKWFVVVAVILASAYGVSAQIYDPLNFRSGVTIYQPPPTSGGAGYVARQGGFTYIYDPMNGNPVYGVDIGGSGGGLRFFPYPNPFDD